MRDWRTDIHRTPSRPKRTGPDRHRFETTGVTKTEIVHAGTSPGCDSVANPDFESNKRRPLRANEATVRPRTTKRRQTTTIVIGPVLPRPLEHRSKVRGSTGILLANLKICAGPICLYPTRYRDTRGPYPAIGFRSTYPLELKCGRWVALSIAGSSRSTDANATDRRITYAQRRPAGRKTVPTFYIPRRRRQHGTNRSRRATRIPSRGHDAARRRDSKHTVADEATRLTTQLSARRKENAP